MNLLFQNMQQNNSSNFSTSYQCYPIQFYPGNLRSNVENGGKILMPPSALEVLSRMNIQYPMLFTLTNMAAKRTTHCGVLEFVADEGKIYVPYWMQMNLGLREGDLVSVKNASLPVATFAKFQPQSIDFLDISNPKAVLENLLREFACLTVGDIIAIKYNENTYELEVLETQPRNSVSIIECDMRVEFAAPVGYEEPKKPSGVNPDGNSIIDEDDPVVIPEGTHTSQPFPGVGNRLDGKGGPAGSGTTSPDTSTVKRERGIPNYDYQPGTLNFFRNVRACAAQAEPAREFLPFEGKGYQLKPKNRGKS